MIIYGQLLTMNVSYGKSIKLDVRWDIKEKD